MAERGRPSLYSEELAARICERLVFGESLRTICESEDMPHRETVRRWLRENEQFRGQYARAKDDQADELAEEALERGRNCSAEDANAARVHIDAIKWYAGKLAPKRYGDKQIISGDEDAPIRTITEIRRSIVDPKEAA